jgi:tripartite-type tricarboxylate transporter receptor subunit TctC
MTHATRRRSVLRLAATTLTIGLPLAAATLTTTAWAQNRPARTPAPEAAPWPSKPLRILVGFPPGSTPDLAARILAEPLSKALGQPVVVENKPGASGNIAADQVAKATDGHTLGVVINGNLTSAPLLNPKLPFNPAKDFALISQLTSAPLVLVTLPNQPAGNDFFVAARNAGDKWNYGSVGIGSVGHLGMELLGTKSGMKAVHVPFQGNPQVVTAMLGGQIQMALVPPGIAMPQVRAGKLRAIGLTGGRSVLVPELAPLSEAGINNFELEVWTALIAPASLPAAAQAQLAGLVPQLVRQPEVRQRLFNAGWQAMGTAPEALKSRVRAETASLGGIIALKGIKAE